MYKFKVLMLTSFFASASITQGLATSAAPTGLSSPDEETRTYHVGSLTETNPFTFIGFDKPEGHGRWSIAEEAGFIFPVLDATQHRATSVTVSFWPLASDTHPQEIEFLFNDQKLDKAIFKCREVITSPAFSIPSSITGDIEMKFLMPNACLPNLIDPAIQDPRKLVMCLQNVDVTYEKAATPSPAGGASGASSGNDSDDDGSILGNLFGDVKTVGSGATASSTPTPPASPTASPKSADDNSSVAPGSKPAPTSAASTSSGGKKKKKKKKGGRSA